MHYEPEDKVVTQLAKLLKENKDLLNMPINMTKDTILHFAAYHKKEEIIRFLVKSGADKEAKNIWNMRPIDVIQHNYRENDEELDDSIKELLA